MGGAVVFSPPCLFCMENHWNAQGRMKRTVPPVALHAL
jgi:hypothetical protein